MDSCYRILGINEDVTLNELKSAYRRLVKKYHPDIKQSSEEVSGKILSRHFIAINNAYNEVYEKIAEPKIIDVDGRLGFTLKRVWLGLHAFPIIKTVTPYSPAHAAGVKKGDIVLSVNDRFTMDMSPEQFAPLFLGYAGEAIKMTLKRGDETHDIFCVRDKRAKTVKIKT